MAFKKTELLYNGNSVTFHDIIGCTLDVSTSAASCVVGSWEKKADFERHAPPALKRTWNFTLSSGDLMQDATQALRADPHWADATEVT